MVVGAGYRLVQDYRPKFLRIPILMTFLEDRPWNLAHVLWAPADPLTIGVFFLCFLQQILRFLCFFFKIWVLWTMTMGTRSWMFEVIGFTPFQRLYLAGNLNWDFLLSGLIRSFRESFPMQLIFHTGSDFEGFTREQGFGKNKNRPKTDRYCNLVKKWVNLWDFFETLFPRKTFEPKPSMHYNYQLHWKALANKMK